MSGEPNGFPPVRFKLHRLEHRTRGIGLAGRNSFGFQLQPVEIRVTHRKWLRLIDLRPVCACNSLGEHKFSINFYRDSISSLVCSIR